MTVSVHASSGWALVISLHHSTALPAQPQRQGERAGETDSFPSFSLSLSSPLFLPICVSHFHSGSLSVKAAFHHCALVQPVTFSPTPLFSAPLWNSVPSERQTISSSCVSLPPSLSPVCTQTRPRRWSVDSSCPARSSGCQFPPKLRQSASSRLLKYQPTSASWQPGLCFSLSHVICLLPMQNVHLKHIWKMSAHLTDFH